MQRVSVRVAKVSLHSYFPPPQLAARCECETRWYHTAMQLNDWSPSCTLHSRVTSCINDGLSSIQIVTVCNVQCSFCKMSLVTVESWMFTNHLAIKLETSIKNHKAWYFLDTSFHEYNYQYIAFYQQQTTRDFWCWQTCLIQDTGGVAKACKRKRTCTWDKVRNTSWVWAARVAMIVGSLEVLGISGVSLRNVCRMK